MNPYEEFFELIFDNLKRIVFPEEWLAIDIAMSKQEIFTMMTVDRMKEATMGQLSENMGFPMSTATGIVDRLGKKGYMERGRSETDRRIVVISLTEKGKDFIGGVKEIIFSYIKRADEVLEDEEWETIIRIVGKVMAVLQKPAEVNELNKNQKSGIRKITIE
jgi:DNA-binding MarR family transcriptional regulator